MITIPGQNAMFLKDIFLRAIGAGNDVVLDGLDRDLFDVSMMSSVSHTGVRSLLEKQVNDCAKPRDAFLMGAAAMFGMFYTRISMEDDISRAISFNDLGRGTDWILHELGYTDDKHVEFCNAFIKRVKESSENIERQIESGFEELKTVVEKKETPPWMAHIILLAMLNIIVSVCVFSTTSLENVHAENSAE
jgi:hypothetical protein